MQNLTPLEIQKQTFSRALKGYSPDEVRAYLHLVAEEIERLLRENDRLVARRRDAPRGPRGPHQPRAHPQGHAALRAESRRGPDRERAEGSGADREGRRAALRAARSARPCSAWRDLERAIGDLQDRAPRRAQQAHDDARHDPADDRARRRGRGERGADHGAVPATRSSS